MAKPKFVAAFDTGVFLVVLGITHSAHATLLLYEPFDYNVGVLAGQGNWTSLGPSPEVLGGSLAYPGLAAGIGNQAETRFGAEAANADDPDISTAFSSPGTYYITGLMQPDNKSTAAFQFKTDAQTITAGFGTPPGDANEPVLALSKPDSFINLNAAPPVVADGFTTHMFALRFVNNGSRIDDEFNLVVDPDLNLGEPNWTSSVLSTTNIDFTEPDAFNGRIHLAALSTIHGRIDELRLATTWGEAAPPDQALEKFTWQISGVGNWGDPNNWERHVPNDTTAIAIFGDAATGPTLVIVDNQFTVNRIEFQSPLAYDITGIAGGTLNLDADIGNASLAVVQGSHVMNVVTNAHRDLHVDIAPGASISFNDQLNLQGNELTKLGDGSLSINGMLNTSGSTLTVVEGTLGGNGTIDGDVVRPGGTLSPESPTDRIGKLTISGNDTQGRGAEMLIEIDGTAGPGIAGGHDQLSVTGSAFLDGRLTIVTDANFSPATGLAPGEIGDTFVILETGPTTVHGEYSTVVGAHLGCGKFWLEIYTPNQMQIGAFDALEGDADGDRDIDITDFNILASNFGQPGMTWTEGSFDKDFDVDITDFNFIAANFADTGYASTPASLIPEPTSLGALGLGGLLLAASFRGGRRMIVLR